MLDEECGPFYILPDQHAQLHRDGILHGHAEHDIHEHEHPDSNTVVVGDANADTYADTAHIDGKRAC